MSTHVIGIKPADEEWKKMKAIWDACEDAKVEIPSKVLDFFNGEEPNDHGVVIDLEFLPEESVQEYLGDAENGYDIFIDKLPEDIKIVRVFNSY